MSAIFLYQHAGGRMRNEQRAETGVRPAFLAVFSQLLLYGMRDLMQATPPSWDNDLMYHK